MRNKRETDISQYTEKNNEPMDYSSEAESSAKQFFKGTGRIIVTLLSVVLVASIISGISLFVYIFTIASEPTGIDLKAKSLNQTSFIMVENKESGEFEEYQQLYSTENRIWVDNNNIPQSMKDAIVAIEDKRFYDHNGVDWTRTTSAVLNLLTGNDTYGGSTLTQQLIKNITDDNEVSITRKLREICKALNLEKEYTKDQILEAYLNVVNFGNNCQGVEAAAQLYFDKSITDCSIAECAAIAGITQNPSLWNPLVYPENNKERREIVIDAMHDQGKITDKEYEDAMKESANITFVGFQNTDDDDDDDDDENGYVQNWYIDELYFDLQADLAELYGISETAASDKLFTEGLKIYCAMDLDMQNYIEEQALKIDKTYDTNLQIGSTIMDFDGRVIATVGSSEKKTKALEWDRARTSVLQPGSSIKPVIAYPLCIEKKLLYFSSVIQDEPIDNYKYNSDGVLVPGPENAYRHYKGNMLLSDAIMWSSNATAAQAIQLLGGPGVAYEQAVTKMGFENLSDEDQNYIGALAIGGMNGGTTVREMAAAYTYLGNGGLYYKPYTYYYVTDSEDNVILDNRSQVPKKAYSAETAGIMNRLLHYNMVNTTTAMTSAAYARIDGWDIIGKTGTTDNDKDSWFCGASPYAVMATWCGFDMPDSISSNGKTVAASFFSNIMGKYLENKEQKDYKLSPNLIEAEFNPYSGLIVSTEYMSGKYIGYYTEDNLPTFTSYVSNYGDGNNDDDDDDDDSYTDNSDSSDVSRGESSGTHHNGGESSGTGGGESSGSGGGESSGTGGGESGGDEGGESSGSGGGESGGDEGGGESGGDEGGDADTSAE
ncbi:MAG: transglycosylase domain-containing protein [Ruminococcus sp.]|nr:transglycosylase domain-containing protein [Ruminococcus sp.]